MDSSKDIFEQYQKYLRDTTKTTSIFSEVATKAKGALKSFSATLASMATMWVISKVIGFTITSLDDYIHKVEKTKEAAEGFTNSVKSFSESTASDTTTLSSLNKEYTELSKGINSLGQNVHLSTEEYDRYKEIISQVSAVMPELGVRYNEQGEKIGFVKGQLSDLNEEYTKYQKNQAKKLLTQGDENGNTLQDVIDNYNNQATNRESIKILKEAVKMSKEELLNSNLLTYQSDILGKRDYDIKKMSDSEYNSFIEGLVSKLETKQAEIDVAVNAYQNSMRTLLVSNDDFYKLAPDHQSALTSMFSSIPENIINAYGLTTEDKIRSFIRKIIFSIKDNEEVSEAFTKILGFDSENATQNSLDELDKYFNTISKAIGVLPNNVKQMFHLDDLEIPTQDITNLLTTAGISKDIAEGVAKGLTTKEIEAVKNADSIDWSKLLNLTGATEVLDFIKNAISNTTNLNEFETQTTSFQSIFDSEDFKNTKEELLKLAKAGELTPYTLSSANEYNTLLEKTGLTAEQVYKKIMKIAHSDMSMGDWSNTLSNARSQIAKTRETQKELNTNGKSATLVETIISDYPQLLGYLDDEEKLRKQLKALQGEQEDVAAQAYMHLVEDSEVYYSTLKTKESEKLSAVNHTINSIISGNKALVGILGETYMVDLNNYKSIADAKARLETELIKNSASAWSKFYKIQINANTGLAEVYGSASAGSPSQYVDSSGDYGKAVSKYVEEQRKQKKAAQDSADAYNEAITALEKITKTTQISTEIPKSSKDNSSKIKDSYSKFAQTIYWCVQTITNLTNKIGLLNSKLNNTNTLDKQISYYNNLIIAQQKLVKGYEKEEQAYKRIYNKTLKKLSKADRKKVEDGSYLIENFKGKAKSGKTSAAEKRYNNIQSALKARDNYLSSQTDLQNAIAQLNEYATSLAAIKWDKVSEEVDKLSSKISILNTKMSNTSGYEKKNKLLDEQINLQKKSYEEQEKIYKQDKKSMSNVYTKISSKYKKAKYKNSDGTIKTDGITNATQLKYITKYNAYVLQTAEEELEILQAEQELLVAQNQAYITKAENIQTEYNNRLMLIDAEKTQLDNEIALSEAKAMVIQADYYQKQAELSNNRTTQLKEEKKTLEQQLSKVKEYSDTWYELKSRILEVDETIQTEGINGIEYINKQIESIKKLNDAINNVHDSYLNTYDFIEKMSKEDNWFDDDGNLTEEGLVVMKARRDSYLVSNEKVKNDKEALKSLEESYQNGSYDNSKLTYEEARRNLLKQLQDDMTATNSYKESLIDFYKEIYQSQIDALQEVINKKKESLNLDKSEYDYQKSIAEKNKNITTLQKQLAMLDGRTDEETNAERQKIQLQLEDALEDLDDTQYEKYLENIENSLDDMLDRLSNLVDEISNISTDEVLEKTNAIIDTKFTNLENGLADIFGKEGSTTAALSNIKDILLEKKDGTICGYLEKISQNTQGALLGENSSTDTKEEKEGILSNGNLVHRNKRTISDSSNTSPSKTNISNKLDKATSYIDKIKTFIQKNTKEGYDTGSASYTNDYIHKETGGSLSNKNLVKLADMLGVSHKKNNKLTKEEDKNLYKKLKQAGFSSGGIVEAVNQNGDSGLATLKAGESVLTPLQTNAFLELVGKLNPLNNTLDIIQKPNLPNFDRSTYVAPANIENVNFAFNLPNVVDSKSLIKTIQSDTQVQRTLQNATVGKLNGNTKFGVNKL